VLIDWEEEPMRRKWTRWFYREKDVLYIMDGRNGVWRLYHLLQVGYIYDGG
jgi:hypothetical protein